MDNIVSRRRELFNAYKNLWQSETAMDASPKKISEHSAYQSIIKMGWYAIPFIIEELKDNLQHWFYALRAITGEDPVKKEHQGYMQKMAQDWINWWEKYKKELRNLGVKRSN